MLSFGLFKGGSFGKSGKKNLFSINFKNSTKLIATFKIKEVSDV